MNFAHVEKEALKLSISERAQLADRLLSSLAESPDLLSRSFGEEAEQRLLAFREGKLAAVSGPEAMQQLRARLSS